VRRRRKKLTKGQAFASQFDFVNPCEIDWVFSRLLGKKFLETIKKINSRAGKHPWKCCRSRGLVKNWHNFEKMFEQRNEIAHLMKRIRLSKDDLCSLCNNTKMFMEQANVLVYDTEPGANPEQDFFHEKITEQKNCVVKNWREQVNLANRRRRRRRRGVLKKDSSNLRPVSTTLDKSI
jgi:hypothetical protein